MFFGGQSMPEGNFSIGIDPVSIISVCAFAAVVLVLAILAVASLFKQKKLLAQINDTLMRQGASAPSYTPPVPNACPKCGVVHAPEAGFCQNCGLPLQ
jgi:hypothetical protein